MKHTKGDLRSLIVMVLIIVIGLLTLSFLSGGLRKGFANVMNPLKKIGGLETQEELEKQKEEERVKKELFSNAGDIFSKFGSMIKMCLQENPNDKLCLCDSIDFTKLNDYSLKLSNEANGQVLELLDSRKVPVKEPASKNLGTFFVSPIDVRDIEQNTGSNQQYDNPTYVADGIKTYGINFLIFSDNEITFNKNNKNIHKSKGKTTKINFIKLSPDVIAIDEEDKGFRKCGEKINCIKRYGIFRKDYETNLQYPYPMERFDVCKAMNPNECYKYNNQYSPRIECKDATVPQSVISCSKNIPSDDALRVKLVDSFGSSTRDEAHNKYKYVYLLNDIITSNSINKLISELKTKDILFNIILIDTIKPFESNKNDDNSPVIKQMYNSFYGKRNSIILFTAADGTVEIISGEDAQNKLEMNDKICQRFLDKLQNGISEENLKNLLEDVKRRLEEDKAEYREDAINFFTNLVNSYKDCLSKQQYSADIKSGIIGACKCSSKVSLSSLHTYKIEFKAESIQQEPFWRTTLELKDTSNKLITSEKIDGLFKPCARALAGAQSFPVTCPTTDINTNLLKDYSINGELWLAKGKDAQSQGKFGILFLSDKEITDCPSTS